MIRRIIILAITAVSACMSAASEAAAQTPADTVKSSTGNTARQSRLDSLRELVRHHAMKGDLLVWSDSLIGKHKKRSGKDSLRLVRHRNRMAKRDKRLGWINGLLTARYFKINVDTNYIKRPTEPVTLKFRANFSGSLMDVDSRISGQKISGFWVSRFRGTASASIIYRGIGAGFSINPMRIAGKSKDSEFNINSYGNKMGFDIIYEMAKTDHGTITRDGTQYHAGKGSISRYNLYLNYYYAFNGKRFSFPAAFSQSYIQRRSAGSWLIGASVRYGRTKVNANEEAGTSDTRTRFADAAIGAGYAYNFCIGKRWLLHLSALPTIVIYDHENITYGGKRVNMKYHFPNFLSTARTSLVYSWGNKFMGLSSVLNGSYTGNHTKLKVIQMKWRTRLLYGFRF